ncbi:ASCH domain-containing protein, partial [Klebsiella pneumoniae]
MPLLPAAYSEAISFSFGDSPELADELLGLVLAGKKTATCGALRDFGAGGEPMPQVGRRDIVLDGQGRPAAVIETTEVTVKRFDEVDESFARDEGEGDLSLAYWRGAHETYFARNGGFAPDMDVVCERFRLIQVLVPDRSDRP